MKPVFKIEKLNFTYNKGQVNEYKALIDISFEVFPEEFIILYGPSGCGKSTLLNVLAGLELPEEKTVYSYGRDVAKMTKKEHVDYHRKTLGMVFQSYNLITSLSVLDNVVLPQIFLSSHKRKRDVKGMELLERFGIKKEARKLPTELSGGQQQRIGIARAIINDPQIILADEPVGNLDSVSAKNVLEILKDLNEKEKKTLILVTHNPDYLVYGDRILYLRDGIIVKEEINKNKNKVIEKKDELPKAPTTELQNLMRTYEGLTPEQINILIMPYKAKIFTHHFITTRNMEETKLFEDLMQRRLMNSISPDDFLNILNRPYFEGGVGFDMRTAKKIAEKVERLMGIADFVYQERRQAKNSQGGHDAIPLKDKVERATQHIIYSCFSDYSTEADPELTSRMQQFIYDRLDGKKTKVELFNILDKPFRKGGVGLNVKTAKAVSEEIELMLILGYGVSQNKKFLDKKREQIYSDLEKK